MLKTKKRVFFGYLLVVLLLCGVVCETPPRDTHFVSSNPFYHPSNSRGEYDGGDNATVVEGEEGEDEGTAEREIVEADIIKVDSEHSILYALSSYRGLVIIDISRPEDLRIIGRYRLYGVPFEMYLKDGVAYVIFSSFWVYTSDYGWQQTSKVIALDVTEPANIRRLGEFDLAGEISDSRQVGDVIYLVAKENGWCWRCSGVPRVTVTSISAADPDNIVMVDQLSYEDEGYWWGDKSIYVNSQRVYIAGPDWSDMSSTVQIIDISNPSGVLRKGAAIVLEGIVQSRWQMDEYEGVFRVITQGNSWEGRPPVIETFRINSSNSITRLGRAEIILPRQEQLMSVRFDGPRAYAVTFERRDPLFTIDLSDPANPRVVGELEMPGWLYYMEPKGDRLIALGYDFDQSRSLTLSLFDVTDLGNPTMLARVNFGTEWGWMVEDQDRIHKALKIFDDMGLIAMPFAGWGSNGYESGIQLFDFTRDSLTLRGTIPHRGYARRVFYHNDKLYAYSEERLENFDITDRDNPVRIDSLRLARDVYRFAIINNQYVAELSRDWWSGEARLDILSIEDPDNPEPISSLRLSSVISDVRDYYYYWYSFSYGDTKIFYHNNHLIILWGEYVDNGEESGYYTRITTINVEDIHTPYISASQRFPIPFPYQYGFWYGYSIEKGETIVKAGDVIGILTSNYDYWWYDEDETVRFTLHLIDISGLPRVRLASSLEFDSNHVYGRLLVNGNEILTSHMEPEGGDSIFASRFVRYYMDIIDVSNPEEPQITSVNIPGSLIAYDPGTNRIITVSYHTYIDNSITTGGDCYSSYADSWFDYDHNLCYYTYRNIELLQLDSSRRTALLLDQLNMTVDITDWFLTDVILAGDYLFYQVNSHRWVWDAVHLPQLHVVNISGNRFHGDVSTELPSFATWLVKSIDDKALVISDTPPSLMLYGISEDNRLSEIFSTLLTGYAYDIQVVNNYIITANSMWGVQVIEY